MLFAVECVYYHAMNTPEAVKMVLDTIASPNLRVICDLANYVGPENASVDAQRRLWDKVGSWYGDKIVAIHFKGQNFKPDGTLYSTSLEDSCVDYAGGFEMLRQMPQASLPVLREEAVPAPRGQRYCIYEAVRLLNPTCTCKGPCLRFRGSRGLMLSYLEFSDFTEAQRIVMRPAP